jgi:hypothetical protein
MRKRVNHGGDNGNGVSVKAAWQKRRKRSENNIVNRQ